MQANSRIQRAQPQDLPSIKELLTSCELPCRDLTVDHIHHFHLIKHGDELIAVGGLEIYGTDGLLRSLAVAPSQRSRGLGKKLTEQMERYARGKNLIQLFLLTTTADGFFRDQGYFRIERVELPEQIRQSPQAAEICPSSAIVMQKRL